ncbi:MAG: nitroreductase, partial [Clostridia bacterium]|nr:nitroreductase [Clostridia bacterium]
CFGVPTAEQKKRPKPPRFRVEDVVCENGYAERDLAAMLMERQGRTSEEFAQWITRFRNFKWDSDFSREMTRSVRAMLDSWRQGN